MFRLHIKFTVYCQQISQFPWGEVISLQLNFHQKTTSIRLTGNKKNTCKATSNTVLHGNCDLVHKLAMAPGVA